MICALERRLSLCGGFGFVAFVNPKYVSSPFILPLPQYYRNINKKQLDGTGGPGIAVPLETCPSTVRCCNPKKIRVRRSSEVYDIGGLGSLWVVYYIQKMKYYMDYRYYLYIICR